MIYAPDPAENGTSNAYSDYSKAQSKKDAALSYAARGWHVFPCHTVVDGACSCGKSGCENVGKHPRWDKHLIPNGNKNASTDSKKIQQWWRQWPDANIGICTGAVSNLLVLDVDAHSGGEDSLKNLEASYRPMPETVESLTGSGGGSRHLLFKHPGITIKNSVGKAARGIASGLDVRCDGGYIIAPKSLHQSGRFYEWEVLHHPNDIDLADPPEWLIAVIQDAAGNASKRSATTTDEPILIGARNDALFTMACSMRRNGVTEEGIIAVLEATNTVRCQPPLAPTEIRRIAHSAARYDPATRTNGHHKAQEPLVEQLDNDYDPLIEGSGIASYPKLTGRIFIGPIGKIVRKIAPHSEADDIAIFIHLFTSFGIGIGPSAFYRIEAEKHGCKIFAATIGDSSKARKGTAAKYIRHIFKHIDSLFIKTRYVANGGLTSGEGLVAKVADTDEDNTDKRFLVIESELTRTTRNSSRQGSILSHILRQAWDGDPLETLTRHNPMHAENHHIGIVAHCTQTDLVNSIPKEDLTNGFGNRFLWFCVHRSKLLPFGGNLSSVDFSSEIEELRKAWHFAQACEEVKLDAEARSLWAKVYPELTMGQPGILGSLCDRSDTYALRIAMIYALSEQSAFIGLRHLEAALSLVKYSQDSVRYIFGVMDESGIHEAILTHLNGAGEKGLTMTQIHEKFGRNKDAKEIRSALQQLERMKKARQEQRDTGKPGRKPAFWIANGTD